MVLSDEAVSKAEEDDHGFRASRNGRADVGVAVEEDEDDKDDDDDCCGGGGGSVVCARGVGLRW